MTLRKWAWIAGPVYCVVYTLFFAGWFFHRPVAASATVHAVVAAAMLSFLCLPFAAAWGIRTLGRRRFAFAVVPAVVLFCVIYACAALGYYHTRRHPFDPVLQKPPALLMEYDVEKQSDVFRILALGGSTTANSDLKPRERYPSQLQWILQHQCPALRIQVINAGKGWYTTQHSLINYVTYCRQWKADLVIVMHAINDINRSFSPPRYSIGEYNDRWSHYYGPSIRGAKPPSFESAVFDDTFARYWYETVRIRPRAVPLERLQSIAPFEVYLRSLVRYVRADGAMVMLVTQPSLFKSEMTDEERSVLWFGRTFCVEHRGFWNQTFPSAESMSAAMRAYNSVVRGVACAERVPVADAASQIPQNLAHFRDDCHYTPAGARKLAEIVAEMIGKHRLIRSTAPFTTMTAGRAESRRTVQNASAN